MEWYYMQGGNRMGPVGEPEFQALVSNGTIAAQTYVWREGMAQWQRYGDLQPQEGIIAGANYVCAECGGMFAAEDMVRYGEQWVCAQCKPVFFQRLKEGAALPGVMVYAGFWVRFGAVVIDSICMNIVTFIIGAVIGASIGGEADEATATIGSFLSSAISVVVNVGYETFFVGRFGATLGKMAAGIKVVRPDGSRVTYLRAFGRVFGKSLSGIILGIGYIMAAFDDEKRALHDRICDTRVVRK